MKAKLSEENQQNHREIPAACGWGREASRFPYRNILISVIRKLLENAGYMTLCNRHEFDIRSILIKMAKEQLGPIKHVNSGDMQKRLDVVKDELMSLYRDMYWLVQDSGELEQQQIDELKLHHIMDLKLAVDNLRELLWKYVDAVSKVEPERVQQAMETHRLRRVSQLLQLLRERLGNYSEEQEPVSFIEKITAAIKDKLAGGGKAA